HLFPQPAGFIHDALVHPDLSGRNRRHIERLFPSCLELLTSLGLAVSRGLVKNHVHKRFIRPREPRGIPRPPIGDPADVEMATEDGSREIAVGRGHGFTWDVRFLAWLWPLSMLPVRSLPNEHRVRQGEQESQYRAPTPGPLKHKQGPAPRQGPPRR